MPQQNNLHAYKHKVLYNSTLVHIRGNIYISIFFWTGLFTYLHLLSYFQPDTLNTVQANFRKILTKYFKLFLPCFRERQNIADYENKSLTCMHMLLKLILFMMMGVFERACLEEFMEITYNIKINCFELILWTLR